MIHSAIDKFLFKQTNFVDRDFVIKLISIYCILNLIIIAPDMYEIYGQNGLIQVDINNSFLSWYQPVLEWFTKPLTSIGVSQDYSLLIIFAMYLLSLFAVILNYSRLFFSVLVWIIHLMMVNSSYMFSYGADYFISFALFINVCISISELFEKGEIKTFYSFIIRFTQFHLCVVYFFAGFGKILGTDWFDGNAIWLVLNSYAPETVNSILPLVDYPIIYKLLSVSILVELFHPVLIYIPKVRKLTLLIIISLHLSIAVLMGLYTFAGIMIILNIVAFGHYFKFKSLISRVTEPKMVLKIEEA